jgi:hypothetical protein
MEKDEGVEQGIISIAADRASTASALALRWRPVVVDVGKSGGWFRKA